MAELQEIVQAACGHWVPADTAPNAAIPRGLGGQQPVILCPSCLPKRPEPIFKSLQQAASTFIDGRIAESPTVQRPKRKYVRRAR